MNSLVNKKAVEFVSSLIYNIFRYVLLICVGYIVLYPILKIVLSTFSLPEELYAEGTGMIPNNPTFSNFKSIDYFFPYKKLFSTTIKISVFCTILQLISCSLVGYGLGRYKFKGSGLVYAAVLFTVILPTQITLIPGYYNYRFFDIFGIGQLVGLFTGETLTFNLLNNFMAMYTPALFGVGIKSGIYIFLFRQYFASMPKDLEEAAKIDGCGPLKTFLRVMLPNIKPVIVTVALLSMIYYWNDSLVSGVMIIPQEGMTLMQGISDLKYHSVNSSFKESDAAQALVQRYTAMLVTIAPFL